MLRPLYNSATWLWHNLLRVPIRLRVAHDNRAPNPRLTVVCLHGISADSSSWRTTLRELEQTPDLANVRFVACDLLGFGKSLQADWLNYNYEDYRRALLRTLKHLRIKGPLVLMGHSMGSLITANFAVDFDSALRSGRLPEPPFHLVRLILVSPPVLMATELARLPDKAYNKTYASLHRIATDVPAAEVVAKFVQKFSSFRSRYIKSQAFARSMDQVILNQQNYQTFVKLRTPALILHGHFDPLVIGANLRRAAKQNPHLRYQSIIGHHDLNVGKRVKIIAELKKTLKELA